MPTSNIPKPYHPHKKPNASQISTKKTHYHHDNTIPIPYTTLINQQNPTPTLNSITHPSSPSTNVTIYVKQTLKNAPWPSRTISSSCEVHRDSRLLFTQFIFFFSCKKMQVHAYSYSRDVHTPSFRFFFIIYFINSLWQRSPMPRWYSPSLHKMHVQNKITNHPQFKMQFSLSVQKKSKSEMKSS